MEEDIQSLPTPKIKFEEYKYDPNQEAWAMAIGKHWLEEREKSFKYARGA